MDRKFCTKSAPGFAIRTDLGTLKHGDGSVPAVSITRSCRCFGAMLRKAHEQGVFNGMP
jgi:hypothetical protein